MLRKREQDRELNFNKEGELTCQQLCLWDLSSCPSLLDGWNNVWRNGCSNGSCMEVVWVAVFWWGQVGRRNIRSCLCCQKQHWGQGCSSPHLRQRGRDVVQVERKDMFESKQLVCECKTGIRKPDLTTLQDCPRPLTWHDLICQSNIHHIITTSISQSKYICVLLPSNQHVTHQLQEVKPVNWATYCYMCKTPSGTCKYRHIRLQTRRWWLRYCSHSAHHSCECRLMWVIYSGKRSHSMNIERKHWAMMIIFILIRDITCARMVWMPWNANVMHIKCHKSGNCICKTKTVSAAQVPDLPCKVSLPWSLSQPWTWSCKQRLCDGTFQPLWLWNRRNSPLFGEMCFEYLLSTWSYLCVRNQL